MKKTFLAIICIFALHGYAEAVPSKKQAKAAGATQTSHIAIPLAMGLLHGTVNETFFKQSALGQICSYIFFKEMYAAFLKDIEKRTYRTEAFHGLAQALVEKNAVNLRLIRTVFRMIVGNTEPAARDLNKTEPASTIVNASHNVPALSPHTITNKLIHEPISEKFLIFGKDPLAFFNKGIDMNDVTYVEHLLAKVKKTNRTHDGNDELLCACNYAARYGSLEMLRKFITFEPELAKDRSECDQPWIGYPVIAFAVDSGDILKVQALLVAGADINARVGIGIQAELNKTEGTSLKTRNIPLLNYAICTRASLDMIKFLIIAGADVNRFSPLAHFDYKILTPLMMAAYIGNRELVELLLASGADAGIIDTLGKTALDYAQDQEHTHVISILSELRPCSSLS